ncbi:uncharacterized protein LOC124165913 [Ischnura elegans]|uniref:uncharacterized protein LOC124165913 n=1 Tax=Ischnura elegans TaxID=197161 RepID=UPI001ED8B807|nr:uncharacterized protein LOC124165913 [Ischnura elegans]
MSSADSINKSVMEQLDDVDCDLIEAINNSFLANYLHVMLKKRLETEKSRIDAVLDSKYQEEMVQCKKLKFAVERANATAAVIVKSKTVDEHHDVLSLLSGVSDDVESPMNLLKNEFMKSLNQLPMRGFQKPAPVQLAMVGQKIKECDKLLESAHTHCSAEFPETSALAESLKKIVEPDLLPRKEKCVSLMDAITTKSLEVSAQIATNSAKMFSEESSKIRGMP